MHLLAGHLHIHLAHRRACRTGRFKVVAQGAELVSSAARRLGGSALAQQGGPQVQRVGHARFWLHAELLGSKRAAAGCDVNKGASREDHRAPELWLGLLEQDRDKEFCRAARRAAN